MAVNKLPPEEPDLSADEMIAVVRRFKRRIEDVEKFNPDAVTNRGDPQIRALEVSIDDALRQAFGDRTRAYINYQPATTLDTAEHNQQYSPFGGKVLMNNQRSNARALFFTAIYQQTAVVKAVYTYARALAAAKALGQ